MPRNTVKPGDSVYQTYADAARGWNVDSEGGRTARYSPEQVTPQMIAAQLGGGVVNPDGSVSYDFTEDNSFDFGNFLLKAALTAAIGHGASSIMGGGGMSSIGDRIQNFFTPGTGGTELAGVDPSWGVNPRGTLGVDDLLDAELGTQYADAGVYPKLGVDDMLDAELGREYTKANVYGVPPVPSGAKPPPAVDPSGKKDPSLFDQFGKPLIQGAASAAAGALIGKVAGAGGGGGDGGLSDAANAQKAEEDRKAGLRKRINQLYGFDDGENDPVAAAAREAMTREEAELSGANRSFYDEQLGHDTERAFRNNRFALADRGTLGGSAQIDTERELSRDNTIGATRIADTVANAIAGLKANREQERLNATNLVNTGSGEDAVQAAQAGLTRSLTNASAMQKANLTGDLFTAGADSVSTANAGYNPLLLTQYQNRLGSFFNPKSASTARTTAT